jgi:hypothetical protein
MEPRLMPGPSNPRRWLVSPGFDLGWFVGPGLLAAVLGLALGLSLPSDELGETSEGGPGTLTLWIVGVLLVDVAHVWASLYRTYLDREARALHRSRLLGAPLVVGLVGFMLHAIAAPLFWAALAYLAVFHFIKQQVGFVALYLRAGGETGADSRRDRQLATLAVWAATAGPVVYWHARLPREFAWFVEGDFLAGTPELLGTLAVWAQLPILLAFAIRRITLGRRGHPMVPLLVGLTALCWNLGIVWFDDDRVFTLSNVFIHGVPYMALVWVAGGRELLAGHLDRARAARGRRATPVLLVVAVFYGLLVALAFAEEAAWDRLVWHEHPRLFGAGGLELGELGLALAVAALTIPQATHYLLDRWIWRVGPDNPKLARLLS